VDEPMMAKALNKWVNMGVIKEEEGGGFVLLEVQKEGGAKPPTSRQGTVLQKIPVERLVDNRLDVVEEAPSVMTVERQQAEQMKVYWRVCVGFRLLSLVSRSDEIFRSSLREC